MPILAACVLHREETVRFYIDSHVDTATRPQAATRRARETVLFRETRVSAATTTTEWIQNGFLQSVPILALEECGIAVVEYDLTTTVSARVSRAIQ